MSTVTYPEAGVIGLLQGVTELFPVSSLGHSVIVPALIGGKWAKDLDMTAPQSPYLAMLVAFHVATALALVAFFWRDWVRIISGLFTSIRTRQVRTVDEKLAWLLVVGTIPVGIAGLALDKVLREHLGKPEVASVFLLLNGAVLYAAERMKSTGGRGRHATRADVAPRDEYEAAILSDRRVARLGYKAATFIGAAQILALFPGLSRSGSTIVAGLVRGLRHEDAARFAFLLATPVILAAGVLKMPELLKPENHAVRGPAMFGSVIALGAAYVSVRFLTKYFETRTLTPFAIYCVLAGGACAAYFA